MSAQITTPLRRLLKPRQITPLLAEYEALLPGHRLTLLDSTGEWVAGHAASPGEDLGVALTSLPQDQSQAAAVTSDQGLLWPLYANGVLHGALLARRARGKTPTVFKAEVEGMLGCLGRSLSLLLAQALETRELVDETVERYREINLLYQIGETIGTCLDSEQIPRLVLQEAQRCLPTAAGAFLLAPSAPAVSPSSELAEGPIRVSAASPRSAPVEGSSPELVAGPPAARLGDPALVTSLVQLATAAIAEAIKTRQPVIHQAPFPVPLPAVAGVELAALLCVPVLAGARILGVIVFGRVADQSLFTAGEMKLILALASQAALALETVRLHLAEVHKQRLEEELAIGRQIQHSLLPAAPPQIPGWQFAAAYQAARQVGGDLYDFLPLPGPGGRLGLLIADVAGKGLPAALFMAFCRTLLRLTAMGADGPAAVLQRTNRLIHQHSRSELFLTAFYACLDPDSGVLSYANGGHDPPLWYRASAGECRELNTPGGLLGIFSQIKPVERQVELAPGDALLFYTDGITEARDSQGEFFGEERLREVFQAGSGPASGAEARLAAIVTSVKAFIGDAPQADDFTMFVVQREALC